MSKITLIPIGIIHSPFKSRNDAPIQPHFAKDICGTIELNPEFTPALKDLDGFSHITLIYHLHKSDGYKLEVKPFLDNHLRGLFATRSPNRPNPLGLSVVRLDKIESNILYIRDIDALDGTPLLDIKPFIPEFTNREEIRLGWINGKIKKRLNHEKI
ncbi:MAG: tRNA (N6-threonylcarbamoyladenosine(37)-N6)-methyltransferase TrmO [Candidatus Marinimicrobia bacterium]|nr:tRNA (N6-threonylcarbamoyladenosine(37)-N6)-methyltransferase TrmO [Candidatus Neomarinimicrobiota bacterium]